MSIRARASSSRREQTHAVSRASFLHCIVCVRCASVVCALLLVPFLDALQLELLAELHLRRCSVEREARRGLCARLKSLNGVRDAGRQRRQRRQCAARRLCKSCQTAHSAESCGRARSEHSGGAEGRTQQRGERTTMRTAGGEAMMYRCSAQSALEICAIELEADEGLRSKGNHILLRRGWKTPVGRSLKSSPLVSYYIA